MVCGVKMKKMVIAALVAAFVFASCNNGDVENKTNPLIGTWEDTWESEDGDLCFDRFIFTKNEVTRKLQDFFYGTTDFQTTKKTYNENLHGTYQYDSSTITFNFEGIISWQADYSIKGNELKMIFLHTGGTFTYKKIK